MHSATNFMVRSIIIFSFFLSLLTWVLAFVHICVCYTDRCGHGAGPTQHKDERSPVFTQFLDALFHVLVQTPKAFEYTEQLLIFLADHLYSCLFGTFLGNSDKERRKDFDAHFSTRSIWSYVFEHRGRFVNSAYVEFKRPLWPGCGMGKFTVWSRMHCRWDPDAHPSRLSDEEWHDDW